MSDDTNRCLPDLSSIDPLRRAEVMRRIEIIETYLAIPSPSKKDKAEAARKIGIGAPQFGNLVRAWQDGHRPDRLASTGGRVRRRRGSRANGLPPESRAAAEEVLASLPVTSSHRAAIEAVRRLCEERGTRPPSDGMVAYMRMSLLNRIASPPGPSAIVVGRVIVALPVLHESELILPELLLALDLRDGAIRAAALDLGSGPARQFHDELASLDITDVERLVETIEDADIWSAMRASFRETLSRFSTGRLMAKTLGTGIGAVDLIYQPTTSLEPERLLTAGADEPLDPDQLVTVLISALSEHNERRGAEPPSLVVPRLIAA